MLNLEGYLQGFDDYHTFVEDVLYSLPEIETEEQENFVDNWCDSLCFREFSPKNAANIIKRGLSLYFK